jgi:DNA-binding IclR family transcriptional regulator
MDRLFDELVADKLAISQIMMLLKEEPLSTGEIADKTGLTPSEVSRHMNTSSMHGLVRYDDGPEVLCSCLGLKMASRRLGQRLWIWITIESIR